MKNKTQPLAIAAIAASTLAFGSLAQAYEAGSWIVKGGFATCVGE